MYRAHSLLEGIPFLLMGVSVLVVALAFLWPAPTEFPMDDTYIHFVYARNLAEYGKLMFNFPTEKGVGTSSPLWVLLLAGGYAAGVPLHLVAKALGIGALIIVGAALYLLLRPLWGAIAALGTALAAVLSGPMVWFSLSGMETTLFLALGAAGPPGLPGRALALDGLPAGPADCGPSGRTGAGPGRRAGRDRPSETDTPPSGLGRPPLWAGRRPLVPLPVPPHRPHPPHQWPEQARDHHHRHPAGGRPESRSGYGHPVCSPDLYRPVGHLPGGVCPGRDDPTAAPPAIGLLLRRSPLHLFPLGRIRTGGDDRAAALGRPARMGGPPLAAPPAGPGPAPLGRFPPLAGRP